MKREGPPRVLQVLTCDGVGGTEFMVATLVERAEPGVVDMDVVTLDAPGPIAERLARAGVRVRCLGGSGLALGFARLGRILARERYDVVNAYGFKSTAVARGLTKLLSPGTAFVSGVRGLHVSELEHLDGPKSRVVLRLERLGSPLVDVYDANSLGALELLAAQGVPRRKLRYIPNGIDADAWTRSAAPPATVPTILCIARFVARKRHSDLVRAAAELDRAGVPFRLVLAGDGPLLEPTRALVTELGLAERVELPGRVEGDAVRRLLARADLFCLPSLWEGMAGSVMEAMAASLPVVGTDVNGIADLVVDGVTGRLVVPESPAALASALRELLSSVELRERFGEAGRRRIVEEFSVEEMVRAKQDLYRLMAGAGGALAMCGICGWVAPAAAEVDLEASRRMSEVLVHRGPDGEGEVLLEGRPGGPRAWIGHRRLSIIDLSTRASQPMLSRDGSIALTYNGEIYNFRELRRELQATGAVFESDGDTEVVLRAYEAWGDDCVQRIDGMFALAIWDGREDRLLLARDRTGKKPLYYAADGDRIAFGSELKAVLACPWVPRRPDFTRLGEFLTFGYVPHPATFYEGIEQVPPASVVVFDRDGLQPAREYWDALPSPRGDDRLRPGPAFSKGVADLLLAATERRMIADVPLGALLSGGIDSSLVVGLMAKASADPVHTFSIGFADDATFDEREHARAVAEHFATRHVDFEVRLDAVGLMDRLLWHHDQPYADSSAIPTFIVSKLAREHVKVVLNGDGGDEVFAGYDRFRAAALSRRLPAPLARGARRVAGRLPVDHGYYSVRRRAERFLELADAPIEDRYQSWISVANPDLLRELVAPRWLEAAGSPLASMDRYYDRVRDRQPLDRILYANFKTYLPDDLAVKMDRMSMANSLEARSPFLDTALIEHLARLPARHKVGLRRLKPVLREAFGPLLPDAIWDRRKHGFGVPMGSWFRGELGTVFEDEVLAPGARSAEVLQPATVRRLYDEQRAGTRENGFRLWTLLTLERWLRSLERPLEVRPPGEGTLVHADASALT